MVRLLRDSPLDYFSTKQYGMVMGHVILYVNHIQVLYKSHQYGYKKFHF